MRREAYKCEKLIMSTCSTLDKRNPRAPQDAGDVLRGSAHRAIFIGVCPQSLQGTLIGVPECFVRSQQIKIWRDSDDHDDEDVISWYEGYQKRKVPGITACP